MSIKLYILDSHLDYFHENLGGFSEELGERFHQDITTTETRYQSQRNVNLIVDYGSSMKCAIPEAVHKKTLISVAYNILFCLLLSL